MEADSRQRADELLRRFRSDFEFYAPRVLKIKGKAGGIEPFALNKAQAFIHQKIEDQKKRTGKVRVFILKGRQQGCCLDPKTPVLTAGLVWKPLGELRVGEELVATDENPGAGKGNTRKMRTSTVERIWRVRKEAFRITLDDGRTVVCSGNHRWLARKSAVDPSWYCIDGKPGTTDKRTRLKVGDTLRTVTETWGDATLEDAWFGGLMDGEGSFYSSGTGADVAVSQVAGPVYDRMVAHCEARGFGHYVISDDGPRKTKHGQRPVHAVTISGMRHLFRLMGLSRPTRFIGRRWWEGKRLPDNGWRKIVAIESLGELDLVDIQTSTQTYIANGIVSHNSTYVEGRFYWKASGEKGRNFKILTHMAEATETLFGMTRRYHELAPKELQPATRYNSTTSLEFSRLGTSFSVATAGSEGTGRGGTAQYFHGSEVAFWGNATDHMAGIGQIVPNAAGTEIILESTANGVGNFFHAGVMNALEGKGEYELIFVPWMWQPEYAVTPPADWKPDEDAEEYRRLYHLTLPQLYFRHLKITDEFGGERSLFDQEYPATISLAFTRVSGDVFIPIPLVERAQKRLSSSAHGPKILGLDPAEYGDDDSVFFGRQGADGRTFYKRMHGVSQTGLAGFAMRLMREQEFETINIDCTGGYGSGVADILIENGYRVNRVNFGEKAIAEDKYPRRLDEMWGDVKKWLEESSPTLPPDPLLQIELTQRQFEYDSRTRTVLESKKKMRARGLKSPDGADALALTFAMPSKKRPPLPVVQTHRPAGNTGY